MVTVKSLDVKLQTATIVVEGDSLYLNSLDKHQIAALSLLMGFYNPLRRFSKNDQPIHLDNLNRLKRQFADILHETVISMDVNTDNILEKING